MTFHRKPHRQILIHKLSVWRFDSHDHSRNAFIGSGFGSFAVVGRDHDAMIAAEDRQWRAPGNQRAGRPRS